MGKHPAMTTEVEVRCIECRHKWWVGPSKERPFCPKCFGVAVPTERARTRAALKKDTP